MIAHFHIHYGTRFGEQMIIRYRKGQEEYQWLHCQTYDGTNWTGSLTIPDRTTIEYQYGVSRRDEVEYEAGPLRKFTSLQEFADGFIQDYWRVRQDPLRIFDASAFTDVIFRRAANAAKKKTASPAGNAIRFCLHAPDVPVAVDLGVVGRSEMLGDWKNPIRLDDRDYPEWKVTIKTDQAVLDLEYKYVLMDHTTGEILEWESGQNRPLTFTFPTQAGNLMIRQDLHFQRESPWWHGAGLAIPIFSLRSKQGFGLGEFTDLIPMIDFAAACGMNIIQTLPVNDTIAKANWKSSYPYAAISVYALHPLYINVDAIGAFADQEVQMAYEQDRDRLNALQEVDFPEVLAKKMHYLRLLYNQEYAKLSKSSAFKAFFKANASWLKHYAVFSHLRDLYGTPDFSQWPQYVQYREKDIEAMTKTSSESYEAVAFYYFLQYHADKQLKEAKTYGQTKRVVLKGDLPIGVFRHSCDAWVAPQLYNMNAQAGAPPDDYAVLGQNWGFPTYNWEVMAEDGFEWWRLRMQKLAEYFDALRIDHILGFFRIWQIPLDQLEGTMGSFNPCLPYAEEELRQYGVRGDLTRYTNPYIRSYFLPDLFGEDTQLVVRDYLTEIWEGAYILKDTVNTQQKIQAHFQQEEFHDRAHLATGLSHLVSEVLLLPAGEDPGAGYNPRITLQTTYSYKALDPQSQAAFEALYNEYYYRRHNDFWKEQAYWKLPALLDATRMLICGEDLGMIPASVPGVMQALNIISLEIQRMPKGATEFGITSDYPYWSVCSPSCHDMSTIRGWWEANPQKTQRFYQNYLQQSGEAPQPCPTEIVETVDRDHLLSPSLLAIFPLQDLIGMDKKLRRQDVPAEQINDPSNANQHWKYRFHLNLEALLEEKELIRRLRDLLWETGRLHG